VRGIARFKDAGYEGAGSLLDLHLAPERSHRWLVLGTPRLCRRRGLAVYARRGLEDPAAGSSVCGNNRDWSGTDMRL